jgi:hypothetical protein
MHHVAETDTDKNKAMPHQTCFIIFNLAGTWPLQLFLSSNHPKIWASSCFSCQFLSKAGTIVSKCASNCQCLKGHNSDYRSMWKNFALSWVRLLFWVLFIKPSFSRRILNQNETQHCLQSSLHRAEYNSRRILNQSETQQIVRVPYPRK